MKRLIRSFLEWWCKNVHASRMFAGGNEWECKVCLKRWPCPWTLDDIDKWAKPHAANPHDAARLRAKIHA